DYGPLTDAFPAPAPSGPYAATLSVFTDTDPNGLWSLFVMAEQTHGGAGMLAGGWGLTFATVYPIADLSIGKIESPDPVAAGSNLTYTIFVTNSGPATATSVTLV